MIPRTTAILAASAFFGVAAVLFGSTTVRAENWPQFRGPSASGLPIETRLPESWGPEQNVAWKIAIPGVAWSQPVVWGDRIFVTTAVTENQPKPSAGGGGRRRGGGGGPGAGAPEGRPGGEASPEGQRAAPPEGERSAEPREAAPGEAREGAQPGAAEGARPGRRGGGGFGGELPDQVYHWMVICLDRKTGEIVWERQAHEGKPTVAIHRTNTYASETPITDGERLYVYFGMHGLFCYDLNGELLWNKDLGTYPMQFGWGAGASPALEGDRLFVQCDNEKESFLVALDKRTGNELWRVPREEKSTWSTPYIWKNRVRTELVTAGSKRTRAYDPADGRVLWELGELRGRCSATPIGNDDLLYFGTGGGPGGLGPLVAIKAGAEGEITIPEAEMTREHVAWTAARSGPSMASPLLYQGNLYIFDANGGIVGCYDAATGTRHYRERIEGAKGFTSSPWAHGGKIYALDEGGQTFVLAPGAEYKILATNKLDDMFWSSVAVAGDHLLLRGLNHLYAIAP